MKNAGLERSRILSILVGLLIMLTLVACGSDDGEKDAPTDPSDVVDSFDEDDALDAQDPQDIEEDASQNEPDSADEPDLVDDSDANTEDADAGELEEPDLISSRMMQFIDRQITDKVFASMVIAVVDGEDERIYKVGELDNGEPPGADILFEIASVTKTFTALLLAQAVEAGDVALSTTISELLPDVDFSDQRVGEISLEELATHSSGLPRMPTNFEPASSRDPYADYGEEKLLAFLETFEFPGASPDASFEYSNLGMALLGYLLARHADVELEELYKTHIFEPLGMDSTKLGPRDVAEGELAPGHSSRGRVVPNWDFNVMAAAGGILSNGQDMLRYLKANMHETPAEWSAAFQLVHEGRAPGPGPADEIGLGWFNHQERSAEFIWHNGLTGGYTSFVAFSGERGVVVLANTANDQGALDDIGVRILLEVDP